MSSNLEVVSHNTAQEPPPADDVALLAGNVVPRRPTALSRIGRYALMVGGICAALGPVEGGLVGLVLPPRNELSSLIVTIGCDRGLGFGIIGAGFGAVIGAMDWFLAR